MKKLLDKINNSNKMKKIMPLFLVICLLALVTGLTYAIWNKTLTSNINTITSGVVSMSFIESSNVITIDNALPISDSEGKVLTNYFDFSVTSNMNLNNGDPDTDVNYEIIIESLSVDTGYTALTDDQIKVYLENKTDSSVLVEPTLISDLNDSDVNKILLSTKHTHSYETNSITTNYRLRAWIDYDVDASSWTSETKYEYKFRININGDIDALEKLTTPTSCFEFESDGNGGAQITNYLCDATTINQTSTSLNKGSISTMPNYLDSNNSSKKLTNEVITDVVIPSIVTASLKHYPTQEELTDDDRAECAVFFTENLDEVSAGAENYNETYQGWYTFCSGGTYHGATLDDILPMVSEYEEYFPGISDLKVFGIASPEATYQVTSIGAQSFYNKGLTSVVIPNSVTTIGTSAFAVNLLTSVTIPNSVTTIETFAFAVNLLTSVTIPNSVTTLAGFSDNQLTSVTIPNSVTTIGDSAFSYNNLTSVTIPNSVTSIGKYAFRDNKLTSLTLGNSVTTIENYAFFRNQLTSIIIPDSVITIGEWAFRENNLTNLTLGNSVTLIGLSAFRDNKLTSVTIPNSVTTIEAHAFSENYLTSLTLGNSVITIGNYAFNNNYLTSITIPNSVTTIGEDAFSGNYLTSVTIPSSVTSITESSFDNLVSVTIDSNNPKYNDGGIGSIIETATNKLIKGNASGTIPNTIVEIGDSAFAGYYGLTNVVIPNSVTTIGKYAFSGNQLTSVIINSGSSLIAETGIGENAFLINENLTIYNNSGKAFKWIKAVSGADDETTFVTGTVPSYKHNSTTYSAVTVTTGSPS